MSKETNKRARVHPTTAEKLAIRKAKRIGGNNIADVLADVVRKAELYEKDHPESKVTKQGK